MSVLSSLSDDELLALLESYAKRDRENLAEFIACLSIVDQRIATRRGGYGSLYEYCTRKLLLSEDESYRRVQVARASVRFPEILSHLRDGTLNLSTAAALAPKLLERDFLAGAELLSTAQHKTRREVEELVAPIVPGARKPSIKPVRRIVESHGPLFEPATLAEQATTLRYDFSFEAPKELKEIFDRSADLLWHKIPFRQPEAIFLEWGRDWLKRHDLLQKPAPKATPEPAGDRPPGWARSVVWKRDGGRCAYVAADGTRCETRRGLEVDHVVPRSLGGGHQPENLRLLCRPHNDSERRRVLGEGETTGPAGPYPS